MPVNVAARLALGAWRLYRTSALARRALDGAVRRAAREALKRQDAFADAAVPQAPWAIPRPTRGAPLRVVVAEAARGSAMHARLFALLNHWRARYEVVAQAGLSPETVRLEATASASGQSLRLGCEPDAPPLEHARELLARVYGDSPCPGLRARISEREIALDAGALSPRFVASPWGSVLPDAIERVLGGADWRTSLPPLVSARVDDVTGEAGFGWLAALEDAGIRPSVGTLHDVWMRAGPGAVERLVAASRRGVSVCPHAFDMDTFIWYRAPAGAPFSAHAMDAHRAKLARDVALTGLVLGRTLNAHFDVIGDTAAAAARALGFRYVVGEHALSQDWREPPRARDPLGTPVYSYGALGDSGLFGFQAAGAIASAAAPGSRYDWLRNFVRVDGRTNRPIAAGLDRAGAVRQGVEQLLSALHGGFPAYLLAHEVQLDALGRDVVGALVDDVLRDVRARVPGIQLAAFDELPAACERHVTALAAAAPRD